MLLVATRIRCLTIDLAKEDISQIVYEVVNHKAANACDKDKRAPKPRTGKRHGQDNQGQ